MNSYRHFWKSVGVAISAEGLAIYFLTLILICIPIIRAKNPLVVGVHNSEIIIYVLKKLWKDSKMGNFDFRLVSCCQIYT